MISTLAGIAGKAALSLLFKFATQTFFEELILWVAEEASKSTKTKYDDKLVLMVRTSLKKQEYQD